MIFFRRKTINRAATPTRNGIDTLTIVTNIAMTKILDRQTSDVLDDVVRPSDDGLSSTGAKKEKRSANMVLIRNLE